MLLAVSTLITAAPIAPGEKAQAQEYLASPSYTRDAFEKIQQAWENGAHTGNVSTSDYTKAGVAMHVGFFMTPTYYDDFRPTWHPQKCAGTFAKSSCHDPQAKPDKINRWSFLPSTLVSKHRPKIFDTHNGGVPAGDPDSVDAGIIIDLSVTSLMCAYQNDVASDQWTASTGLCPKNVSRSPGGASEPSHDLCGTCEMNCNFESSDCSCGNTPVVCSLDELMYEGPASHYFPYNEIEVEASFVSDEAILAIFYTQLSTDADVAEAKAQWQNYTDETGRRIPLLRYVNVDGAHSPTGFTDMTPTA